MRLQTNDYNQIQPLVDQILYDPIYVNSIVSRMQEGVVYVDNEACPASACLLHACGFTFVLGAPDNKEFSQEVHALLAAMQKNYVICLNDSNWANTLHSFSDLNLEPGQRFCFQFPHDHFTLDHFPIPGGYQIIPMDADIFKTITGKVIPTHYWKSADHFLQNGYGVCLIDSDNNIVSSSFSACIANGHLDIGIQTMPGYEGHGFATMTAARMVSYALSHGYAPVWGCNSKNVGSYCVAHKLGFTDSGCWNTLLGKVV